MAQHTNEMEKVSPVNINYASFDKFTMDNSLRQILFSHLCIIILSQGRVSLKWLMTSTLVLLSFLVEIILSLLHTTKKIFLTLIAYPFRDFLLTDIQKMCKICKKLASTLNYQPSSLPPPKIPRNSGGANLYTNDHNISSKVTSPSAKLCHTYLKATETYKLASSLSFEPLHACAIAGNHDTKDKPLSDLARFCRLSTLFILVGSFRKKTSKSNNKEWLFRLVGSLKNKSAFGTEREHTKSKIGSRIAEIKTAENWYKNVGLTTLWIHRLMRATSYSRILTVIPITALTPVINYCDILFLSVNKSKMPPNSDNEKTRKRKRQDKKGKRGVKFPKSELAKSKNLKVDHDYKKTLKAQFSQHTFQVKKGDHLRLNATDYINFQHWLRTLGLPIDKSCTMKYSETGPENSLVVYTFSSDEDSSEHSESEEADTSSSDYSKSKSKKSKAKPQSKPKAKQKRESPPPKRCRKNKSSSSSDSSDGEKYSDGEKPCCSKSLQVEESKRKESGTSTDSRGSNSEISEEDVSQKLAKVKKSNYSPTRSRSGSSNSEDERNPETQKVDKEEQGLKTRKATSAIEKAREICKMRYPEDSVNRKLEEELLDKTEDSMEIEIEIDDKAADEMLADSDEELLEDPAGVDVYPNIAGADKTGPDPSAVESEAESRGLADPREESRHTVRAIIGKSYLYFLRALIRQKLGITPSRLFSWPRAVLFLEREFIALYSVLITNHG